MGPNMEKVNLVLPGLSIVALNRSLHPCNSHQPVTAEES